MKTFLAIIGGLALAFIALIAGLFFVGANKIGPLIEEATAYVNETVPAVAGTWDGAALVARVHPDAREGFSDEAVQAVMQIGAQTLGHMTSYDGGSCMIVRFEMNTDAGEVATAQCSAAASFELGTATFDVVAVKSKQQWGLLGFHFKPSRTGGAALASVEQVSRVAVVAPGNLEISLHRGAIALTNDDAGGHGIGVQTSEKIENIR